MTDPGITDDDIAATAGEEDHSDPETVRGAEADPPVELVETGPVAGMGPVVSSTGEDDV